MKRRAIDRFTVEVVELVLPIFWLDLAEYTGKYLRPWLELIVDDYLTAGPGRFIPFPPVTFQRGSFAVEGATVRGHLDGPFGAYKRPEGFVLVHLPAERPLATLPRLKDCESAANELADLTMRWDLPDGGRGRLPCEVDAHKVEPILKRYVRAAK